MTFNRLKQTGSGRLAWRLVIEGLDTEFVTDDELVGTSSDGRERVLGLSRRGIVISNGADLVNSKLTTEGFTATIVDIDGRATNAFAREATRTTYATTGLTVSSTGPLVVASTSGWPDVGALHIGTERIQYASKTSTTFVGLTRGTWDTIAQAHYTLGDGPDAYSPEVTDAPATFEGRRAYLYVYGDGDAPAGNGTRVFTGVISRDARVSGGEWSIAIDGIARLLDVDFSGPSGSAVKPRGIYYPYLAPLVVELSERTGNSYLDPVDGGRKETIRLCGFFETQDAFCRELNTRITAAMIGWSNVLESSPIESGEWSLRYRTAASPSERWLDVRVRSCVDRTYNTDNYGRNYARNPDGTATEPKVTPNTYYDVPIDAPPAAHLSQVREMDPVTPGIVPRGIYAHSSQAQDPSMGTGTLFDFDNFPGERLYLDADSSTFSADAAQLAIGRYQWMFPINPAKASVSDRYIYGTNPHRLIPYSGDSTSISLRRYVSTSAPGLAGVVEWLQTESATLANIGGTPLMRTSDFAPESLDVIRAAQRGRMLVTRRRYIAPKSSKTCEYLAEECKLAGLSMCLNASGQIQFIQIRLPASTETSVRSVDASNTLTSTGFPNWERNAFGSVNAVRLKIGYDPVEDKHFDQITIRDVTAYARSKLPRILEIAPKSQEHYPNGYSPDEDIVALASGVLGIFGRPYRTLTIPVPWTLFDVAPGESVTITSPHLPNKTGTRGVASIQGLVLSKAFRADDVGGTLTVLVHGQNIAGYTPTSRRSSSMFVSGTTYDVTLSDTPPDGYVGASAWKAGMKIRLYAFNSTTTANDRFGYINSVTGDVVRVTLDALWTLGSTTWNLGFDASTTVPASSDQARWAFVARNTALITHEDGTAPARTFAP